MRHVSCSKLVVVAENIVDLIHEYKLAVIPCNRTILAFLSPQGEVAAIQAFSWHQQTAITVHPHPRDPFSPLHQGTASVGLNRTLKHTLMEFFSVISKYCM